ncbi:MAG: helix-turn-helix transcriptional regulator, partial [Clostridia bacterium]|nr:helix-turn-helix transcriptional regulator [Clostridia bacterium]
EEVFFNIIIEVNENRENTYTKTNPVMYKALEYIDENLLTIESIDEICNKLFITKSHLHHLFIKHLNITPKKYITAKRLALARQEIYAGKKATEVCIKCGFQDDSAFYRAYKKHFGKNPSGSDFQKSL